MQEESSRGSGDELFLENGYHPGKPAKVHRCLSPFISWHQRYK